MFPIRDENPTLRASVATYFLVAINAVIWWIGFYVDRIVVPAFFMLGYWFLLQLVAGAFFTGSGGVAFWAHVGGFAAGLVLVRAFCDPQRLASRRSRRGRTDRFVVRMN
jgi:membrane associated rhomboid family serine protease